MGETRNTSRNLVEKHNGKWQLGRLKWRLEGNIKMDLGDEDCENLR
jgi:hypothetical protein